MARSRVGNRRSGDAHPRFLQNFTRVETFGSPNVHLVRASVDTRTPEVFSFQPEIVEENVTVTP